MGAGDVAARDVVRAVVESKAGNELAYFGRLTRFDDSWALWRLRRRRGRDESLAFGPGETAALITSVVWIALNEAAKASARRRATGCSPTCEHLCTFPACPPRRPEQHGATAKSPPLLARMAG